MVRYAATRELFTYPQVDTDRLAENIMAKKAKKATVKVRDLKPKKNAKGGLTNKMLKDKW